MPQVKSNTAEYMKIRRHVMNLALRAGASSIRLPTIHELARQFEVSNPTVCKALKELSNEGYVTGKPGIGSFTNPSRHFFVSGVERQRLVGLLARDGMVVHGDRYTTHLMAELMKRITDRLGLVHLFNLGGHDPERVLRDIRNEQLDALVWLSPPEEMNPVLEKLREDGMPVVVCDGKRSASNNVRIDYEGAGREIGERLLAENRGHIVYLPAMGAWGHMLRGIREVYDRAGVPMDEKLILHEPHLCVAELERLLAKKAPIDAVCCSVDHPWDLAGLLTSHGVDIERQCRLVQGRNAFCQRDSFRGFTFECDFMGFAHHAVDALDAMTRSRDFAEWPAFPVRVNAVNLPA